MADGIDPDALEPARRFATGTSVLMLRGGDTAIFLAGRTSGDPWQAEDGAWRVEVVPEQGLRHVVHCDHLYVLTPDRLAAVLWAGAESLGADGWHPIETAPRDGSTKVDLWIEGGGWNTTVTGLVWQPDQTDSGDPFWSPPAHWANDIFELVHLDGPQTDGNGTSRPTHWRPTPARPRDLKPREKADG